MNLDVMKSGNSAQSVSKKGRNMESNAIALANELHPDSTEAEIWEAFEAYMKVHIESQKYDKAAEKIHLLLQARQHQRMEDLTEKLATATQRLVVATWALVLATILFIIISWWISPGSGGG